MGAEAVPPILEAALAAALAGSATRVRVDLPVDLPSVVADREMLGRALEHLARNAREAMNDGGVLLVRGAVRVIADSDVPRLSAGSYCELVFQDEGPGVPAELHPKIFDAYYTTRPRGSERGMGLGLALVRAIVHHHRGSVSLAPPDARGAVFTILLPAHAP
ncbi:MAG: sensor histidine kinase [Myxococcales bacterium]|nr:sensor histidine kinase [Myxococcales bacterium]